MFPLAIAFISDIRARFSMSHWALHDGFHILFLCCVWKAPIEAAMHVQ